MAEAHLTGMTGINDHGHDRKSIGTLSSGPLQTHPSPPQRVNKGLESRESQDRSEYVRHHKKC